jgi:hypothetical protein
MQKVEGSSPFSRFSPFHHAVRRFNPVELAERIG